VPNTAARQKTKNERKNVRRYIVSRYHLIDDREHRRHIGPLSAPNVLHPNRDINLNAFDLTN
jgi:hypothetical protein